MRGGRAVATPALGAILGSAGATATVLPTPSACAAATYTSHVTLVVEHASGGVIGLCIGFDGSSITGQQILQASGVEYATSTYGSLGQAVCQIDHEPPSYPPGCWTSSSPYWAMFVSRGGGAWQAADRGISSEPFSNGDAEGFRYDQQNGAEPAPASPAGICTAALSRPTAPAATTTATGGAGPQSPPGGAPPDTAAPAASALPASSTTPAPGVIEPAGGTPAGVVASSASSTEGSGPSPALLVASAAGGVLAGLAVLRLVLRRRRA